MAAIAAVPLLPSVLIGSQVPESLESPAVMPDGSIGTWKYKDLGKGKLCVFFFYSGDFSYVCPEELKKFADHAEDFKRNGTVFLPISTDSTFVHSAFQALRREQSGLGDLPFPMLSDTNHVLSNAFGTLNVQKGYSYRGVFIVDDKSILRYGLVQDERFARDLDDICRVCKCVAALMKDQNLMLPYGFGKEASVQPIQAQMNLKEHFRQRYQSASGIGMGQEQKPQQPLQQQQQPQRTVPVVPGTTTTTTTLRIV